MIIITCRLDRWGVTKAKTSSETGYKYACFGLLRRLGFSFDQVTFTILKISQFATRILSPVADLIRCYLIFSVFVSVREISMRAS